MNSIFSFLFLSEITSESQDGGGSSERIVAILKNMVKSPLFYIVLAVLILLIVLVYLLRRIVKAKPNTVVIVIRKGKISKIIDEKAPKYFMIPFIETIGARISLLETKLASDKLFINDGPDSLYKISFELVYKVSNPTQYYFCLNNFEEEALSQINDTLREFADEGEASVLIKDYRKHGQTIVELMNKAIKQFGVEAISVKYNYIEPVGKK